MTNSSDSKFASVPVLSDGSQLGESAIHLAPPIPHPPVESYLQLLTAAVVVYLIVIAAVAFIFGPITAAKIIAITVFGGLAIVSLAVIIFRKWILMQLITLEELGFLLQEETIVGARTARVRLRTIKERLESSAAPIELALMPEIMKNVGPLVTMIMKRETGTLNWLMFGAKVAKSAFDALKHRR